MRMLSTTVTTRPSSSDLSFFSSSHASNAVASSSRAVVVRKRFEYHPVQSVRQSPTPSRLLTSSSHPLMSSASSSNSSPFSTPPNHKKRKASPQSHAPLPREVKRLRASAPGLDQPRKRSQHSSRRTSRASSPQGDQPPSPAPIYRSSRSRSTSLYPSLDESPILNRVWATDEDGDPGPNHCSSEYVVSNHLIKSYRSYFKNYNDPNDLTFKLQPHHWPVAELEYPNSGAVESFALLVPKDKDHYNPIMDLEQSLYTIVECYLTSKQQELFGPIPNEIIADAPSPPPSPSPSPSPPRSISSISDTDPRSPSPTNSDHYVFISVNPRRPPILRAVQRAIRCQDGPLFVEAIAEANRLLHALKYPMLNADMFVPRELNPFEMAVRSWQGKGMPKKVLMRIIEENYQRSVGPHVQSLKQYEAFTSTVYGELMPSLVYEMLQITKLNENSLFLDLGSGVGNVVAQASVQTGCRSYGIEILPAPARVAREMKKNLEVRCRMWGVRIGEIELEEGNMLDSPRVNELMSQADVVLVDNKVFEESLNEALRPKFLDLKEGAIVISLKPFVASLNARMTERNVDDMSTIFDVTEHPYHSGGVSWGNNGGSYYLHRVDRTGYADIRKRFEDSRTGSGRNNRLRK